MGGLFSTKQKTKTNQTQTNTATTTPNVPTWASGVYQDYLNNNLAPLASQVGSNPQQFIPGANSLQQQAYGGASGLGDWRNLNNTASTLALAGATGGPNLAGPAQTYTPSQIPGVTLPSAHTGQATTFQAPQIGGMQGYQAPQVDINSILSGLGPAPTVSAGSASAGQVGPTALSSSRDATSTDASQLIGRFENPYIDRVRNAALAQADANAGRVQAADTAQAAGAGAFSSSRYGIREAELATGLARERNSLDANLLDSGFRTALDAALRQGAQDTGVSVGNADRFTQNSQFNSGQTNENQRTQAGLDTNASIATAGNQTQANIAGAGFARDYGLAGLDAQTRAALTNAGLSADSLRFLSEANNNRTMQQGQFDLTAASQNADAGNRFGLANLDALNTRDLTQGGFDFQRNLSQAGFDTDAARFGAEAGNRRAEFDAGQGDNYLARLLSGAGLMYQGADSYGANSRGDVGTQLEAGNQQYGIDAAQAMSPLTLNALLSQMYRQFPLENFTGQTVNGNQTLQGTNVQSSTPSPFNIAMSLASLIPSDPALKTDISPAGRQNGFNLYNYRYRWDEPDRPLRTGVMADEIEDVRPDAVAIVNGMRHVDYGALGLSHLVEA